MTRKFVHMSVVGDKELIKKLGELGGRVYKRVVSQASRKAFTPVVKTAKQLAPTDTGQLRKSIGVKQKKYPRAGRIVTLVGPRTGFAISIERETPLGKRKTKRDPVKYGHLVEFGTSAHMILVDMKDGAYEHPGSAAQPFMRPAFDGNINRSKQIMKSELAAGVIREAKRK